MASAALVNALVLDAMRNSDCAVTGAVSPSLRTPYPLASTTLAVLDDGHRDAGDIEFLAGALHYLIDILLCRTQRRREQHRGGQAKTIHGIVSVTSPSTSDRRHRAWTVRGGAPPA